MNLSQKSCVLMLSVLLCATGAAANYPLKTSSTNPRILVDQSNVPFLMVGDSPQALMVNASEADATMFFTNRRAHGFNTVWINLLCTTYTGGRSDASILNGTILDGTRPFTTMIPSTTFYDLATPNEVYFDHVDQIINLAAANGIQILLDPIETGGFLTTMLANGTDKCRAYGQYLGNRYKNFPNIIWLSGNDFQGWMDANNDAVVAAVALGIKAQDTKHLHTVQLDYPVSSSLNDPTWAPIIDLNAAYTYYPTYAEVLRAYNQSASTPVFMMEAHYEDEFLQGELGTAEVLRRQEYWTMLSGATGQLYGNRHTWPFDSLWQSYLDTTGVTQLGYMKALFEQRAWYELIPDQDHSVVTEGYGTFSTTGNVSESNYATAARTADGTLVMVYLPTVRKVTVDMSKLNGAVAARWFDPANGTYNVITGSPFANVGTHDFTPPGNNSDGDGDWVLLLETQPEAMISAGIYNGLFREVDAVRQGSAGFFTVSITTRGTYSGRLQMGMNRYSFSGQFDLQGQAANVIVRPGNNPLTVELQAGEQADQIAGRVTDGVWNSPLLGNLSVYNSKTFPAPYAGAFTLIIPGQSIDASVPVGDGFGTVRVSTSGKAKFVGALADGTKVSQGVSLSRNGDWPLYVSLYTGRGSAAGWLKLANESDSDLSGLLSWIKPADGTARYYPNGFTTESEVVGSAYHSPVGGMGRILNLTTGLLAFSGGNLMPNFTNSVALGVGSKVTNLSENQLTLKFSSSAGTFKGVVEDPASGRAWSFNGAVLQKLNIGCGFLSGTNQVSRVALTQ